MVLLDDFDGSGVGYFGIFDHLHSATTTMTHDRNFEPRSRDPITRSGFEEEDSRFLAFVEDEQFVAVRRVHRSAV